ncbi:MAG: hypothetical protein ABI478_01865 [Propionivibrio sp.]
MNHIGEMLAPLGTLDAGQLVKLARAGCSEVQGYHFSCPLPANDFVDLLRWRPYTKGV